MLLTSVWKNQPGKYFCVSTKDRFDKWEDHFFRRSEFGEVETFITENLDKDVYWCPHGFSKPRRLKQYADIPKMLWADLDEVDPRDLGPLTPTIAWESSPGRYACLWYIDSFMTEELNQALTNHIGADKGGWDITQVLRVPGTKNYKYDATPKVKLLWADGESFETPFIEKKLPKKKKEKARDGGLDAKVIYKKYEKKFNTFIRRELINGKPVSGKRSEVIWKLCHSLLEAGCSRDEVFELLRVSPWNKFADRHNGDAQLRREVDKALDQHLNVSVDSKKTFKETEKESDEDEDDEKKPRYEYLATPIGMIEEENIDWLWYPFLARGELTILEGDPGLGKSYLAQIVSLYICDGRKLPSTKQRRVTGRVAYFDMENSPASITRKRLRCNGIENVNSFTQETHTFSIDDEDALKDVEKAMRKLKPALVVFDTINMYLGGKTDTYKASDVQQAMSNFVEIARRHNAAVLVLRHLTKGGKEKALYRGQGSIAFAGLARIVLTMGQHPDEPDIRVLATTKNNITKHPKAMSFTIEELPDTLKEDDRSKFSWGDWIDITADEIVSAGPIKRGNGDKGDDAEKFLESFLEDGPSQFGKLLRAAEAKGFTSKLLHKAATRMGITMDGHGSLNKIWSLPDKKEAPKKKTA